MYIKWLSKQIQHTKQPHVIKNCAVPQTKATQSQFVLSKLKFITVNSIQLIDEYEKQASCLAIPKQMFKSV